MSQKIEDASRARIARMLPDAIDRALASYQLFLETGAHENAKEFKAHHDACKVAIAHVELLIKLAQWADLQAETVLEEQENRRMHALMQNAKTELEKYQKR